MGEHPEGLVVLLLLADKEHAYLCVVYHILYLLLAAGGIEGHADGPYAERSEVGVEILEGVLREHADVLLYLDADVQQGVRHMSHLTREFFPRHRLPLRVAKVTVNKYALVSILLCLFVD